MRIFLLSLQIYFLAVEFQPSKGEDYPKDAVICSHSESSLKLSCDDDEFLRIHNATYAYVPGNYDCTSTSSIVQVIEASKRECKLVSSFKRCDEKPACTIRQEEAATKLQNCRDEVTQTRRYDTNALRISYSCEKVPTTTVTITVTTNDVRDPSMKTDAENRNASQDPKSIGVVVGVVVGVVITAVVIIVCVVCIIRKRRQKNKNGRPMELVATSPTPALTPSPESVAIYSVARDVDEDGIVPNIKSGNLTQQEIGDVGQMYAVVDKSRKTKAKSNDEGKMNGLHAGGNIVNDVMNADNGDVIICENDELYDATSFGEDKQNKKKDVNETKDTDSVIMYENTELYS